MTISIRIGLDAISSYKRLAYEPWYALAEFVDNSTQAYLNNKELLNASYEKTGDRLTVRISYESDPELLRIRDNSIGMNLEELEAALHVARPPVNTAGRSKYGMGMKTAACWLGNVWTITTKKLGETVEHEATVDVERIAAGQAILPYKSVPNKAKHLHYTIIEIRKHNRVFQGRTLGKIKQFLSSMYREDFRAKRLVLEWRGQELSFDDLDQRLLKDREGGLYKMDLRFTIKDKYVWGWVGILDKGSRADAGFSLIHYGRVVRGWPDAYRPEALYGQFQGSNDLVNQRLVGELHLDSFEVSHTKDNILWLGDEEDLVQEELRKLCADYREIALSRRKTKDDERGPSRAETDAALMEFKREIESPELVDKINIEIVLPQDVIRTTKEALKEAVVGREATFKADVRDIAIRGYLIADGSVNDPYIVVESSKPNEVLIIINQLHPHWTQIKGSEGVLNYLRHCTYDALAEWQARHKAATLDPDTIKMLKDHFLRLPLDIEMHQPTSDYSAGPPSNTACDR